MVSQTIADDLFNRGAAALRFPSRLDGNTCIALLVGRGVAHLAGNIGALTDRPRLTDLSGRRHRWSTDAAHLRPRN